MKLVIKYTKSFMNNDNDSQVRLVFYKLYVIEDFLKDIESYNTILFGKKYNIMRYLIILLIVI